MIKYGLDHKINLLHYQINSSTFEVNAIDDSEAFGQCLLISFDNKYLLKIVGKNSENLAAIKVILKLKHKYFKKFLEFKLQSDKDDITRY